MSEYLRHNLSIPDDEDILRVIRRSWASFFWDYFFLFLFIVSPFFLIVPLFRLGMNGIIIFFALLWVGVFLALRTFVSWYFNALIITSFRIFDINQRGFFDRIIDEAAFTDIRDVTMHRRRLVQLMFRHGTLVVTRHDASELVIRDIPSPVWAESIIKKSVEHMAQRQEMRSKEEVIHKMDISGTQ